LAAPKESNYESEKAEIVQEKNPKPKFNKESSLFHFYFFNPILEKKNKPIKRSKIKM